MQQRWQAKRGRADSERVRVREGGGVMPIHLDISALHFPGNRWKQCIKAPRGNPGHPGIAEAWPGSEGAGGHLFHALNRLPHPPSLWWAWLCVRVCVCLFACGCVEGCIYICVQYVCLGVSPLCCLQSGVRGIYSLVAAWFHIQKIRNSSAGGLFTLMPQNQNHL